MEKKRVKTLSQIADEYGIHINTLSRWLAPIKDELKINRRKLLLSWQIQMVYDFLNKKE